MSTPDIPALARLQLADYDAHRPGSLFEAGVVALSIPQAYDLQLETARLRRLRGEQTIGYKLGCVSTAIRRQFGLDSSVFGHIFSSEAHRSGAIVDHQRFDHLAIEGEFALRLAEDIPDAAWLRQNSKRAVAAVFPVIELHNYVFRAGKPSAQELIASNALHAGVVLPVEERGLDDWEDLLSEPITVSRNGEDLGTSSGNGVPGGPVASLIELVEQLAGHGVSLKAGELILSGSPLPLYPVSPGDHIEVHTPRLGSVTMLVE